MRTFTLISTLLAARSALAATAEEWRGRSIYQIITDRFARPDGTAAGACDPGQQTWCGGNWNTIRANLDYIQNAGFTAIWISPVSQNFEGPRSAYGDPYHGYWISDATKLNSRFGTADDLKALSDELHRRGMYLMVDVVVNNVMANSMPPNPPTADYFKNYMFKNPSQYHSYCPIDYSNTTSEEQCWFGDEKVPLPDVNTEDPTVVSTYQAWIKDLVQTYNIDGLRLDAAKHVNKNFWPQFCEAAGVFCIGEVFDADVGSVAEYQGPSAIDSVLNYPTYDALVQAFAIPGPGNVSHLADVMQQSKDKFVDPGLLGNFLENHDLPRWSNMSVDIQSKFNAMTFNFMSDGIPIVYYGQEQGFTGAHDPYNREPLWTSGYEQTSTLQLITKLNTVRNFLANETDWLHSPAQVLTTSPYGIAFIKSQVITILTNIGSPPKNVNIGVYTPFSNSMATTDVLTCRQYAVGSNGTVEVQYNKGGQPVVLVPSYILHGSDICADSVDASLGGAAANARSTTSSAGLTAPIASLASLAVGLLGLVFAF